MGLWQDLQFAGRLLVKDKSFTLVAVLALALGIGVNATVFTFVNAVLIRGLPFSEPDRIFVVDSHDVQRDRNLGTSYLDFRDLREQVRSFTGLAAYDGMTANVSDEGHPPERYAGSYISGNAFGLIGQPPMIGRDFQARDDQPGADAVVLIGAGIFKNRYGSDPSVVGRTIRINDVPALVIGVMPEGFKFPSNADLWMPLANMPNLLQAPRNSRPFSLFGRLAPGVTRAQATAELTAIGQRLAHDHPDTNTNVGLKVQTFNEAQNGGPIRAVFLSLMGAVAFVLLIACANVANLLLARSAHRSREISVRVSLGASRRRIVRQLLVESVLLALIAGVLGLGLSIVGIRLFDAATQDVGKPYWIQFTMDLRVFLYLAAICLGTGIVFGLAPALHVSKTDVNEILKEGGRSGAAGIRVRRWTGVLLVGEIAMTLVLLAGAGFMMRNFLTMYRMDLGVGTSNLLTMSLALPDRKYPGLEERLAFYQRLQDRLQANSQFRAVTLVSNLPSQGGFSRQLGIEGRPLADGTQPPVVTMLTADPRYFETMGITLLRGRGFTDLDGSAGQENAVVNSRFAQMHFPGEDPIGRRISLSIDLAGGAAPTGGIPTTLSATIVGVVPNVRQRNMQQADADPIVYLPFRADPRGFMQLLARADGDPAALTTQLREAVQALDQDLPLFNIRTMDQVLEQQRWPFRVFGTMFALFAFIALLLSAVGLYAVTAYSVAQRTPEIGVRMALGAESPQVMWLFLRRGFWHVGIGLALGVLGALGVGKVFGSAGLLVQTSERDPVTIGAIAVLLGSVAVLACIVPARRATRLDPLIALRRD